MIRLGEDEDEDFHSMVAAHPSRKDGGGSTTNGKGKHGSGSGGSGGSGDEAGLSFLQQATAFGVSVAAVLGTGILALPIKLYPTGYWPFALGFAITLLMQIAVVYFLMDLLQQASNQQVQSAEHLPLVPSDSPDDDDVKPHGQQAVVPAAAAASSATTSFSSASNTTSTFSSASAAEKDASSTGVGYIMPGAPSRRAAVVAKAIELSKGPSLHRLSELFLGKGGRIIFNLTVVLHFVSVLISYVLAWSKAFCQLVGCNETFVITPFVAVFTAIIIVFFKRLQPLISLFTFIKCAMLIVMIACDGYVAAKIDLQPTSTWSGIGAPFLIGTLSLGGVVNVMPMSFSSINSRSPTALSQFRRAVCLGVVVCWMLNMLWAYFVLMIVPQRPEPGQVCHQDTKFANGSISLECSFEHDEISTQPVLDTIRRDYPSLLWLGRLGTGFIIVSISVSYLTVGSGFKHLLDGFLKAMMASVRIKGALMSCPKLLTSRVALQGVLYLFAYAGVMVVALFNPQSFLLVLEIFASLALNVSSGFFVAWMYGTSHKGAGRGGERIALPTGVVGYLWPLVALFYLFAIYYDIYHATDTYIGFPSGIVFLSVITLALFAWWLFERRRSKGLAHFNDTLTEQLSST